MFQDPLIELGHAIELSQPDSLPGDYFTSRNQSSGFAGTAENELLMHLTRVEGSVESLVKLIPDPFRDTYTPGSAPGALPDAESDLDISLAAALFPSASKALIERLGRANMRRRQYLNYQVNGVGKITGNGKNVELPKKSSIRQVAKDAFNFQKPSLKQHTPAEPPVATSTSAYPTTAPSLTHADSVFSRTKAFNQLSATSVVSSVSMATVKLAVPRPPVRFQNGQQFLCPYCRYHITIGDHIMTEKDWRNHVFNDLNPYLCTFEQCSRDADRVYGLKDDWSNHETAEHERDDRSTCPLCSSNLEAKDSNAHIADHLEQLALAALPDASLPPTDDDDANVSELHDDTASEQRTKLEILNDFVEEQLEYLLPNKQLLTRPGLEDLDFNLDLVGDSDEDEDEPAKPDRPTMFPKPWESKVAEFLDQQLPPSVRQV
jgi:hypothetical protein